jgi:hypothetical protein
LGVAFEQDLAFVSVLDACTREEQSNDDSVCYRQIDGARYLGTPLADRSPATRVGFATTRIQASWDRVVAGSLTAAFRIGYAIHGRSPSAVAEAFLPIQAEARASYWFAPEPFNRTSARPFVFAGLGVAQVDVRVTTQVRENVDVASTQGGNDINQHLDVWKRSGRSYATIGGGLVYATSAGRGIATDLKVMQMFPARSLVLALEVGYVVGF